ncbi:proline-rich receptor-like protein kinase PERK2 [Humulus lupulus]|uniref:proline-rich receptor-like protein kinase PERK2 n=1 Tax=Humulus lupulus TaxID=3486 RepID=UPI002B40331F|nr:proline-rich receptor-like protein kinase PERK2 [Humulus lupulus]
MPTPILQHLSPLEVLLNTKPDYNMLRVLGCRVYISRDVLFDEFVFPFSDLSQKSSPTSISNFYFVSSNPPILPPLRSPPLTPSSLPSSPSSSSFPSLPSTPPSSSPPPPPFPSSTNMSVIPPLLSQETGSNDLQPTLSLDFPVVPNIVSAVPNIHSMQTRAKSGIRKPKVLMASIESSSVKDALKRQ